VILVPVPQFIHYKYIIALVLQFICLNNWLYEFNRDTEIFLEIIRQNMKRQNETLLVLKKEKNYYQTIDQV
jgi:hypothetical protein